MLFIDSKDSVYCIVAYVNSKSIKMLPLVVVGYSEFLSMVQQRGMVSEAE